MNKKKLKIKFNKVKKINKKWSINFRIKKIHLKIYNNQRLRKYSNEFKLTKSWLKRFKFQKI